MFQLAVALYSALVLAGYVGITLGWSEVMTWVYSHETLSGGLLALASALVGAWLLYRQTSQAERHARRIEDREEQRQRSRRESARTVLPLGLLSITDYAMEAAQATKALLDQCQGEGMPDRAKLTLPASPTVPSEAISMLRDVVAELQPGEIRPLSILVADIQVQAGRLRSAIANAGHAEHLVLRVNLEEYVIDCARIHARASSLFDFSRGVDASPRSDIRWVELRFFLYHLSMWETNYPRVFETMGRRAGGDFNNIVDDRWSAAHRV